MNKDKLDKVILRAKQERLTPGEFGQMLCGAPYNLTPPEATPLMKEYASTLTPSAKKPSPLKSDLYRFLGPKTHRVNKGENVSPVLVPPAQIETREPLSLGTPAESSVPRLSIINRSAVKSYALKVAKEKRPKFKRVSAEFLDGVQASLETVIRGLAKSGGDDVAPDTDADWFVNGRTVRMAEEQLNIAVRAIVAGKVLRHPSIGVTLK